MSFISAIGLAVPENRFEQSIISGFMERLSQSEEQRRKIKTVFRASGIKTRHSVLPDYGRHANFSFFSNSPMLEPFPGTAQRMRTYQHHAAALSVRAVNQAIQQNHFDCKSITHLITVSCTGMYAPGLDIDLVNQLALKPTVNRTCINFMGCFAAITALKTADVVCRADRNAKVLIVCTELCSLHFQKDFTDDNILANALFADGAAALVVEGEGQYGWLSIQKFQSTIVHQGADAMAWGIGDFGFEMRLSTYVPDILAKGIQALVDGLFSKKEHAAINHYAIHPGGKKILDVVGDALAIPKEKLEPSYAVLQEYGNMSSPSVVFVLKQLLDSGNVNMGDTIMGMAFGPGLTMESFLVKRV